MIREATIYAAQDLKIVVNERKGMTEIHLDASLSTYNLTNLVIHHRDAPCGRVEIPIIKILEDEKARIIKKIKKRTASEEMHDPHLGRT